MHALALNWVRNFRELLQWGSNPFLVRELQRARRHDWLPAFLFLEALALALAFVVCAAVILLARATGFSAASSVSIGSSCAAFMSLIHVGAVLLVTMLRGGEWIIREAQRGTLEMLLATPISPVQMVLKHAAYPFISSMMASLVPLPFYVLCAALGGPGLLTMLSFYFLVTVLVISASGVSRVWALSLGGSQAGRGVWVALGLLSLIVFVGPWAVMAPLMGLGSNPLAFPLMAAEWVARPHTFYGFPLPPLVVGLALFPLWVSGLALGWARRLDFDGRLATPATRAQSALLVLLAFVVLGYAWPGLVTGQLTAQLVTGSGLGAAAGRAPIGDGVVHLAWWLCAAVEGGLGLGALRLAEGMLSNMLRRDIPLPQESV